MTTLARFEFDLDSHGNLGAWGHCKAHGEQWGRYREEPSGRELVECPVEFCEMEPRNAYPDGGCMHKREERCERCR